MSDWFYDPYSGKLKTKVGDNMYVDAEGNYEVKTGENMAWDPSDGDIHRVADPDDNKKSNSIFGLDDDEF